MILLPSPVEEILRSWIEIAPFKLPLGRVESPLSDFRPSPVYQYAHKERPAESPDRPAGGELATLRPQT